MAGKLGRTLRAVRTALLTVGVVGVIFVLAASVLPGFFGFGAAIVTSGSMGDALPMGSVAFTRNVEVGEIAVGDIITFRQGSASQPTTHRVVATALEDGRRVLTTKGDANATDDATPLVASSGTMPRLVAAVPFAGYVLDLARGPAGIFMFLVVPVAGLLFDRQGPERGARRRAKRAAAAAGLDARSAGPAAGPVLVDPSAIGPLFADPVALEVLTPPLPAVERSRFELDEPSSWQTLPNPLPEPVGPDPAVRSAPVPLAPSFQVAAVPLDPPGQVAAVPDLPAESAPLPLDVPVQAVAALTAQAHPAPPSHPVPPVISLPATSLPPAVPVPVAQAPLPAAPLVSAAPPPRAEVTSLEPAAIVPSSTPPAGPPTAPEAVALAPVQAAEPGRPAEAVEVVTLDEPASVGAGTSAANRGAPGRPADWSWDFVPPEAGRRRARRR